MALRSFIRSHPVIPAIAAVAIIMAVLRNSPLGSSLPEMLIERAVLSALTLGYLAYVVGREAFAWQQVGYALRKNIYQLAIALVIGVLATVGLLHTQGASSEAAPALVLLLITCLLVGVFEEGAYRGILQEALVEKMGSSRKGVLAAVIIASLTFGFVHNLSALGTMFSDPIGFGSGICKMLTSGQAGFLWGMIYLKTRCLWGIAIGHGLNDFLAMMGQTIVQGFDMGSSVGNYVSVGMAGQMSILGSLFMIVVQIPFIVIGMRIFKTIDLSTFKTMLSDK